MDTTLINSKNKKFHIIYANIINFYYETASVVGFIDIFIAFFHNLKFAQKRNYSKFENSLSHEKPNINVFVVENKVLSHNSKMGYTVMKKQQRKPQTYFQTFQEKCKIKFFLRTAIKRNSDHRQLILKTAEKKSQLSTVIKIHAGFVIWITMFRSTKHSLGR